MRVNNENETAQAETLYGTYEDCEVSEKHFPQIGKCCRKRDGPGGVDYEKICSHCDVWISPPDPSTLEVAAIFECTMLGYIKRIKNVEALLGRSIR